MRAGGAIVRRPKRMECRDSADSGTTEQVTARQCQALRRPEQPLVERQTESDCGAGAHLSPSATLIE